MPHEPVPSAHGLSPSLKRDALLTAAANKGITIRYGEQPTPIRWTHASVGDTARELTTAGVPDDFALREIFQRASQCALDKPPKSLKYFCSAVIEAWHSELAHRDAATTVIPDASGSQVVPLDAHARMAIRYAQQGDAEWVAECERLGLSWKIA